MLEFLNKKFPFSHDFIRQLKIILGISLGMFLFILFFQPIDPAIYDFNYKLLIIAGFGVIIFLLLCIMLIFIPSLLPKLFVSDQWTIRKDVILNFIIWMLISTAFSFYSQYLGNIEINFYSASKILLLGLLPVVLLIVLSQNLLLRDRIKSFTDPAQPHSNPASVKESDATIIFESESKSDSFSLKVDSIVLIKSANNYIEIFWKDKNNLKKSLIRNTLNNAEQMLQNYPFLIRCHRTSIVNLKYVENIENGIKDYLIHLREVDESIAISRQYILNVKEAMKKI